MQLHFTLFRVSKKINIVDAKSARKSFSKFSQSEILLLFCCSFQRMSKNDTPLVISGPHHVLMVVSEGHRLGQTVDPSAKVELTVSFVSFVSSDFRPSQEDCCCWVCSTTSGPLPARLACFQEAEGVFS